MAKFSGVIGYGESQKTAPGVTEDVITERRAKGDVLRDSRSFEENLQTVNDDIRVGNRISIVMDPYARGHIQNIRYVLWLGQRWKVASVDVEEPRLILRLGGKYNGPLPD